MTGQRQPIFLVGPMGAGKTSVGRQLARLLHKAFIDLDAEIEARSGADIPWIFDVEGEEGFRKRETSMLAELATKQDVIIATGGGVVLNPDNRNVMSSSGLIVYLAVPADILYERTLLDTRRPLLQVENRREVIDELVTRRDPLYREDADIIFTSENNSPTTAAEKLKLLILQAS